MNDKKTKQLTQMAKNLTKCSDRSIADVLSFLDENDKIFILEKMKEFNKDLS